LTVLSVVFVIVSLPVPLKYALSAVISSHNVCCLDSLSIVPTAVTSLSTYDLFTACVFVVGVGTSGELVNVLTPHTV
jgi:hypothetical protein